MLQFVCFFSVSVPIPISSYVKYIFRIVERFEALNKWMKQVYGFSQWFYENGRTRFSNEKRKTERKWVNEKLIYSRITEKKKTIRQNIYKRKYDDWSEQKSLHLQNIHKSDSVIITIIFFFVCAWKNPLKRSKEYARHWSVTLALILNVLFTKHRRKKQIIIDSVLWFAIIQMRVYERVVHDVHLKLPFD